MYRLGRILHPKWRTHREKHGTQDGRWGLKVIVLNTGICLCAKFILETEKDKKVGNSMDTAF